jgi:hypothetical protein
MKTSTKQLVTFVRLDENAIIAPCDFHSMDGGQNLHQILHPETIGQRPSDFSPDRSFWRPTHIQESRA